MIIKVHLESGHSKTLTLELVAFIGNDVARMSELMVCFFDAEWRICQRAAWAVGMIGEKQPSLIEPFLEQMLLNLKTPQHDAILRNTMRAIHALPSIPENVVGLTVDAAFRFLEDPSVPIAIRMFSMRILGNICKKEPDLKSELRVLLEDILEHEKAPGVVGAARDVLKKIKN
jgi:hypothetical protein